MSQLIGAIDTNLWTEISAIIFLVAFVGIVAWVYSPTRKQTYGRAEKFPLQVD